MVQEARKARGAIRQFAQRIIHANPGWISILLSFILLGFFFIVFDVNILVLKPGPGDNLKKFIIRAILWAFSSVFVASSLHLYRFRTVPYHRSIKYFVQDIYNLPQGIRLQLFQLASVLLNKGKTLVEEIKTWMDDKAINEIFRTADQDEQYKRVNEIIESRNELLRVQMKADLDIFREISRTIIDDYERNIFQGMEDVFLNDRAGCLPGMIYKKMLVSFCREAKGYYATHKFGIRAFIETLNADRLNAFDIGGKAGKRILFGDLKTILKEFDDEAKMVKEGKYDSLVNIASKDKNIFVPHLYAFLHWHKLNHWDSYFCSETDALDVAKDMSIGIELPDFLYIDRGEKEHMILEFERRFEKALFDHPVVHYEIRLLCPKSSFKVATRQRFSLLSEYKNRLLIESNRFDGLSSLGKSLVSGTYGKEHFYGEQSIEELLT